MGIYYLEDEKLWFDDLNSPKRGGTNPGHRIGMIADEKPVLPGAVANPISEGKRVGSVTLFGDFQDISFLNGYVQGKNIKNLQQFFEMNIPHVRANNCQYYKSQRLTGELDHKLSVTRDIALGQNDNLKRELFYLPYNDLLAKAFVPSEQIALSCAQGKPFSEILGGLAYPIVTDSRVNFNNFADPDALESSYNGGYFRDGSLEPLGIRNSFANPNTSFPNILIEGVKGSFMPYHQEQGDWSDSKGSAIIDNKYEFRQGEYDWFEDAQDLAMDENVFSRVGDRHMTTNNNYYSLEGYVSDGIYVMAPFVEEEADKKYFKNKYRQVGAAGAANLLQNSTRTLSIIGTRFKSANSGFIMGPKYDSVNQNIFGTDSIAYMGLLRR